MGIGMTQEDKELLLKDLCARLPYEVKCYNSKYRPDLPDTIVCIAGKSHIQLGTYLYKLEDVIPYLFPLSSMAEEQEIEYDATFATIVYEDGRKDSAMTYKTFDWLNKNHFDYRGLIPMGLAIDATGLNIY